MQYNPQSHVPIAHLAPLLSNPVRTLTQVTLQLISWLLLVVALSFNDLLVTNVACNLAMMAATSAGHRALKIGKKAL